MLIEQVVQRENLLAAYERVCANKGAASERVLDSLEKFLAKCLRLKMNRAKSAVA